MIVMTLTRVQIQDKLTILQPIEGMEVLITTVLVGKKNNTLLNTGNVVNVTLMTFVLQAGVVGDGMGFLLLLAERLIGILLLWVDAWGQFPPVRMTPA